MCLTANLFEMRKQKKAADRALKQSRTAAANAASKAEAERQNAMANQAAEQQTLGAGDMSDISIAKRRKGVSQTFLNDQLGE